MARRWHERMACAAALVLLAGCGQGYPTDTQVNRNPSAEDRIAAIGRLIAAHRSQARSVALPSPCVLAVRWKDRAADEYPLIDLRTAVDTDPASGEFVVHLQRQGGAASPLLLATSDWAATAMLRSEINLLRADCADWQRSGTGPQISGVRAGGAS